MELFKFRFSSELIVRVVQILSEFDDSVDKIKHLEEKYEILFLRSGYTRVTEISPEKARSYKIKRKFFSFEFKSYEFLKF